MDEFKHSAEFTPSASHSLPILLFFGLGDSRHPAYYALKPAQARLVCHSNQTIIIMLSVSLLSLVTLALYLAATIVLWRPFMQADKSDEIVSNRGLAGLLSLAGLLTHSALLSGQLFTETGLNLAISNVGSLISWVGILTLILVSLAKPFENLGIVMLPLAMLTITSAWLFPGTIVSGRPVTSSQTIHIVVSLLAYSFLFLAALQSLLLLVQERQLRQHQPGGFIRALPAMETMEDLMFLMIGSGFSLLTLTLISGVFFSEALFGKPLQFTHHTILSIAAWFVFGVLLLGHWKLGWRGRTAIRWTLVGFVLLILAYFGSKFVFEVLKQA
jgi:ABC-type uncharacterized transport system permease subunit